MLVTLKKIGDWIVSKDSMGDQELINRMCGQSYSLWAMFAAGSNFGCTEATFSEN